MKTPAFFQRSELTATLWTFRQEFLMVGFFSMLANVLMLAPTLYMLQVYDRVLASQSELTLLAMSLLTLGLFGQPPPSFDSFFSGANGEAVRAVQHWAAGGAGPWCAPACAWMSALARKCSTPVSSRI